MPRALITHSRLCRPPAAVPAAVLMVVQAFLAGLATAAAAGVLAGGEFTVICHGNGGAPSDSGSTPGTPEKQRPCCESCAAGAAPALLPVPVVALCPHDWRPCASALWRAVSIPLAARAVRAGPSQAPPSLP
jgi:hypothetical protein